MQVTMLLIKADKINNLIAKANEKKEVIKTLPYYEIFGSEFERLMALNRIDKVIMRLKGYHYDTIKKSIAYEVTQGS